MDWQFIECPFCGKSHDVEVLKNNRTLIIKNKKIVYQDHKYYCKESDVYFEDGKMIDENLERAKEAFQKDFSI